MLEVFLPDVQKGDCKSIQKVLCSGEALQLSQVALFEKKLPHAQLYNLYGPTEAAIDVTYWSLSDKEQTPGIIPIGKPVANTQIYILDNCGKVVPPGIAGELNIGGIQVARGYLNQSELTAEKFIANPFSSDAGSRLYKTGDLAEVVT
ncbi:MAG: AMP-binding protein [Chitinophagaceae bacterium]